MTIGLIFSTIIDMKNFLIYILCLSVSLIFNPIVVRAESDINVDKEILPTGSEYLLRNYPDEPLLTIQVLGGVTKPGIYHIPKKTDVVTLLSLTGGVFPTADLKNIVLRRHKTKQIVQVDLDKVIRDTNNMPIKLGNGDVILVNMKEEPISPGTVKVVTFISLIMGVVAVGLSVTK